MIHKLGFPGLRDDGVEDFNDLLLTELLLVSIERRELSEVFIDFNKSREKLTDGEFRVRCTLRRR